jgi:hypothetical protein
LAALQEADLLPSRELVAYLIDQELAAPSERGALVAGMAEGSYLVTMAARLAVQAAALELTESFGHPLALRIHELLAESLQIQLSSWRQQVQAGGGLGGALEAMPMPLDPSDAVMLVSGLVDPRLRAQAEQLEQSPLLAEVENLVATVYERNASFPSALIFDPELVPLVGVQAGMSEEAGRGQRFLLVRDGLDGNPDGFRQILLHELIHTLQPAEKLDAFSRLCREAHVELATQAALSQAELPYVQLGNDDIVVLEGYAGLAEVDLRDLLLGAGFGEGLAERVYAAAAGRAPTLTERSQLSVELSTLHEEQQAAAAAEGREFSSRDLGAALFQRLRSLSPPQLAALESPPSIPPPAPPDPPGTAVDKSPDFGW